MHCVIILLCLCTILFDIKCVVRKDVCTSPHLAIHTTCNRINDGTQILPLHTENLLIDMFNHFWREKSGHDGLFPVLNLFLSLHILLLEVDTYTCICMVGALGLYMKARIIWWKMSRSQPCPAFCCL